MDLHTPESVKALFAYHAANPPDVQQLQQPLPLPMPVPVPEPVVAQPTLDQRCIALLHRQSAEQRARADKAEQRIHFLELVTAQLPHHLTEQCSQQMKKLPESTADGRVQKWSTLIIRFLEVDQLVKRREMPLYHAAAMLYVGNGITDRTSLNKITAPLFGSTTAFGSAFSKLAIEGWYGKY
jgi:hypothetical protein